MRSTSVSTAHAFSTGTPTSKSLVSSIGRGPPRCRCRRRCPGTLPRRTSSGRPGHEGRGPPRRPSSGSSSHTSRAEPHRVAPAAVVGRRHDGLGAVPTLATARHASGPTNGWSPRPTTTASNPPTRAASTAAASEVAWPSAHAGFSTRSTSIGQRRQTGRPRRPPRTPRRTRRPRRAASTAQLTSGRPRNGASCLGSLPKRRRRAGGEHRSSHSGRWWGHGAQSTIPGSRGP